MFENAGLGTDIGALRCKNFGLDMCLTLRNLVSKVGPFFLCKIVHFQL